MFPATNADMCDPIFIIVPELCVEETEVSNTILESPFKSIFPVTTIPLVSVLSFSVPLVVKYVFPVSASL